MLRGSRRLRGWMALAAFLSGYGVAYLTGAHLIADDDPACHPVVLTSHVEPTAVGRAVPAQPPQHCTLCHLLRQTGGAHISAFAVIAEAWERSRIPVVREIQAAAASPLRHESSRAPPALG